MSGDHLGTPVLLTNVAGAVVNAYDTTPFGQRWFTRSASPTTAQAFPGQLIDIADRYYNMHRDYDATPGRYLQADPIGLAGRDNVYGYVGGNPVGRIDPSGLNPAAGATAGFLAGAPLDPIAAFVGGAIGFGIGVYGAIELSDFILENRKRGKSDPVKLSQVNPGRDCSGNCNPCPPGTKFWVSRSGHGHANGFWHKLIHNQNKETCMCYPDRPSSGL